MSICIIKSAIQDWGGFPTPSMDPADRLGTSRHDALALRERPRTELPAVLLLQPGDVRQSVRLERREVSPECKRCEPGAETRCLSRHSDTASAADLVSVKVDHRRGASASRPADDVLTGLRSGARILRSGRRRSRFRCPPARSSEPDPASAPVERLQGVKEARR